MATPGSRIERRLAELCSSRGGSGRLTGDRWSAQGTVSHTGWIPQPIGDSLPEVASEQSCRGATHLRSSLARGFRGHRIKKNAQA